MPLIILPESHCDHVSGSVLDCVLKAFEDTDNPEKKVIVKTIELPDDIVWCDLHGPLMGDLPIDESQVIYKTRGNRTWLSRLISRPKRPTRILTVVMGPYMDKELVLYTCYGGYAAPKEPGDPTLTVEEKQESEVFWSQHALSRDQ